MAKTSVTHPDIPSTSDCKTCGKPLSESRKHYRSTKYCSRHCSAQAKSTPNVIISRFMAKVEKTDTCWIWTGGKHPRGYGSFNHSGKTTWAHRFSYEHYAGPIPEGLVLDHLCRNPSCVNPAHLEPVTQAENVRRGNAGGHQREYTHCKYGHPFDAANTYYHKKGRDCRTCQRKKSRAWYARLHSKTVTQKQEKAT